VEALKSSDLWWLEGWGKFNGSSRKELEELDERSKGFI
jgi:hypothetical protein